MRVDTGNPTKQYLPRGIDYLGILGSKLRDLQGFAILAYELIQNADDATGVSSIAFDILDQALIVDNDGVFTECSQVGDPNCSWKDEKGYRCDFHRFRVVASGDKRQEPGTIGAFGIGFTAVYQITDQPELISAGRHWIIREDRPENERIEVCPGCGTCTAKDIPGTRFVLPWARDPSSFLRNKLGIEAVKEADANRLAEELENLLPKSMLFLKRLDSAEIRRNGAVSKRFERVTEQDTLIVSDGTTDKVWYLVRGNFDQQASELRNRHADYIEPKRSSEIALAIPEDLGETGVLCAFLPTQHETDLGFHLHADFFPTSDRKRIILEADYQSAWNRAAIKAAAQTLAHNLTKLRDLLGHAQLWTLIQQVYKLGQEVKKGERDEAFSTFWRYLSGEIRKCSVFYSTLGEWKNQSQILLLEKEEEEEAISVLEALGLSILHADLRPYFNLLRESDIGVPLLDLSHLSEALKSLGLTKRSELCSLPDILKRESGWRSLYDVIDALLKRRRRPEEQKRATKDICECALAPGYDGALWPCHAIYRADKATIDLFRMIDPEIPFLSEDWKGVEAIKGLCPEFSPAIAVERLSRLDKAELEKTINSGQLRVAELLGWFENRRESVIGTEDLRRKVAELPIFPSSSGLRPLSKLTLTGNFTDPIGIADVVDLSQLRGRHDFLRDLGATELSFHRYVAHHVPQALSDASLPSEKKGKVVQLLASRLGEIKDYDGLRAVLSQVPAVECEDGAFCRAAEVYLRHPEFTDVLGERVRCAMVPTTHGDAIRDFYRWLGVAEQPRYQDILARVKALTENPLKPEVIASIGRVVEHLGTRTNGLDEMPAALYDLQTMAWLPSKSDHSQWFKPAELFSAFRAYLFESQGHFLDVAQPIQEKASQLLVFLGVRTEPQVSQVVAHLLSCCESGRGVNKAVYDFSNNNAADSSIVKLRNKPCLMLGDGRYVKPGDVFWGDHPFGRYRFRLGPELRRYGELLTRLGVKDTPDHEDGFRLITDIASEFGPNNKPLDEDSYRVLMNCWQLLEQAFLGDNLSKERLATLQGRKVIPNNSRLLNPPEWMFFEDQAGLAAKFGDFLKNNVIPRPQGAWRAMSGAGVRPLGDAVWSHLLECTIPAEDSLVLERLKARRQQLDRVMDAEASNNGLQANVNVLDEIRYQNVQDLKVSFSLTLFNHECASEPVSLTAYYRREDKILYFVRQKSITPWASIARELALALCPDSEPGALALGIKEVLAAESDEAAQSTLDELGFPPMSSRPSGETSHTEVVGELGTKGPSTSVQPGTDGVREGPLDVTKALENIFDGPAPTPTPMPGISERTPAGKTPTRGTQQGRLRTYVVANGQGATSGESEAAEQRSSVDNAGVARVLKFEREQGRNPKELPPKHPGYDIESRDSGGEVVRYIEVKSTAGTWGTLGVGLTKTQFERARELGERYWLYVVEYAEDDNKYKMHRVQDPARRVDQFLYDNGWNALSEENP